jgi:hypothetical protein
MSKTLFIKFRGRGFWAYDVTFSVLMKHLIDAAGAHPSCVEPWLAEATWRWRVDAVICDLGMYLNDAWTPPQLATVIELLTRACEALSLRDEISREEIEGWVLLDDGRTQPRLWTRGAESVRTTPIVRMGEAIIAVLRGALPEAPAGHWWFYVDKDEPSTLKRRD